MGAGASVEEGGDNPNLAPRGGSTLTLLPNQDDDGIRRHVYLIRRYPSHSSRVDGGDDEDSEQSSDESARPNLHQGVHYGVVCDGCRQTPIVGQRFKCNTCEDFDLCGSCYRNHQENHVHDEDHSFLLIAPPASSTPVGRLRRRGGAQDGRPSRPGHVHLPRNRGTPYRCLACSHRYVSIRNGAENDGLQCPACGSDFVEEREVDTVLSRLALRPSRHGRTRDIDSIERRRIPSMDDIEAVLFELRQLQLALAARGSELEEAIRRSLIENVKPVVASEQAIDGLEKLVMEKDDVVKHEEHCCPICQEDWEVGSEASLLPCNHIFHCTCIKTWLLQNNSCPVCRSAIPDDFAEIESEADKGESESSEREASEGDDVALPGISTDQTSTREEETEPREENVHNVQAQVTVP
jgi:DNA-directed RNA polymerase subunit RPC12/RpoP|eukprot:g697.t1